MSAAFSVHGDAKNLPPNQCVFRWLGREIKRAVKWDKTRKKRKGMKEKDKAKRWLFSKWGRQASLTWQFPCDSGALTLNRRQRGEEGDFGDLPPQAGFRCLMGERNWGGYVIWLCSQSCWLAGAKVGRSPLFSLQWEGAVASEKRCDVKFQRQSSSWTKEESRSLIELMSTAFRWS